MIILKLLMWLLQVFMIPFTRFFCVKQRKFCPPINNPILLCSATRLAHMIRTQQISCEAVIKAYIFRIKEVNPIINAVVDERFEQAVVEAQLVDKIISNNEKTEEQLREESPLLGVPLTVKESIAVEGMSWAAGLVHPKKRIAKNDADIVHLCKEAGAIPLLVSNTPELCLFWESYNNVTGRTSNPYDTRRTSAGSSGGEASLLASGASVIGLGSDIAGSLRMPAMFTGVFGHKPTPKSVSVEGHVPGSDDEMWTTFFTTGPLTRYAEDMPLMLSVISKPEKRSLLRLNEPVPVEDIKFYYMESQSDSFFSTKVDEDIVQAMRQFVNHLNQKYSIEAKKVNIKQMKNSFRISVPILADVNGVECPFYDQQTKKFAISKELFRFLTCRSKLVLPTIFYGIIRAVHEGLKKLPDIFVVNKIKSAKEANKRLQNEFKELLKDDGVFLIPTYPTAAHFHNEIFFKLDNSGYLSIFNSLGLPALNCPMGFNSSGLPIGIQVVANPNNDRLAFAVAQEIEKCFGGWKPLFNNNN